VPAPPFLRQVSSVAGIPVGAIVQYRKGENLDPHPGYIIPHFFKKAHSIWILSGRQARGLLDALGVRTGWKGMAACTL
jgi:hypothetical protein